VFDPSINIFELRLLGLLEAMNEDRWQVNEFLNAVRVRWRRRGRRRRGGGPRGGLPGDNMIMEKSLVEIFPSIWRVEVVGRRFRQFLEIRRMLCTWSR
jgi:hypothetical protein